MKVRRHPTSTADLRPTGAQGGPPPHDTILAAPCEGKRDARVRPSSLRPASAYETPAVPDLTASRSTLPVAMAPDEMKYPLVNEAKALVGVLSAPGTLSGAAPAAVAAAVTGELVKNALVALDGAWFETRGRAAGGWQGRSRRRALRARVGFDADTMTLMVADSGVGLTRADLINTLSHTSRGADVRGFAAALAARSGAGLLEAGAGLWTAFAAADRVDVHTKHTDDDCYSWTVDTKDDAASFTITTAGPEAPPPPLLGMIGGCGTAVCLKLRPGPVADALLDPAALRAAVLTHAEASQYSVKLWEDGDDAEAELKAAEAAAAAGDGAGDDDADMDVDADAADEFDHDDAMGLADGSEAALRTVTPMIERAKCVACCRLLRHVASPCGLRLRLHPL